jgi:plastocyanin
MLTRMTRLTLALLAGTLLAYGCGSGGTSDMTAPPPAMGGSVGNTVNATPSLAFSPSSITIRAGDAVTFAFGSVAHNVFFDPVAGAPANIEGFNADVTVDRTFTTAGVFPYTCHIHPTMHGTVIVQ